MARPTETLMHEHRLIEKVLDALEAFAASADSGSEADRRTVAGFAEFFRSFADRCHHGKEEDLLFVELERRGMPAEGGPIGCMRSEHELGRTQVATLTAIGAGSGPLRPDEVASLRQAAAAYVPLLRLHIRKEDDILFPMANNILSAEAQQDLSARFDAFERDHMGETHERMHALADELAAKTA